ncbi:MAG: hypothetical protein J6W09_04130 [Bacteroidales bacterium]|nr:hypothetical protein [Bacteroidales bacterium]
MKSISRLFSALLLPLLLWTGCGIEPAPSETDIPDHCIEITLGGLHPELFTKASSRGADAYNENLVKSVDCFFYPNGASSSDAVFMALGRGAEPVAEGDSTVYKVKVFFTDADANRMFGNTVSGTCQLYVICNAPLSYSGHTDVSTLKNLVVENDFTAQPVQASFVMSADELATVTLTTDAQDKRTASGRVKVSRSAAKIQFFLLIPSEFEDESHQIWEPALDAGVSIDMANSVKRGKVDGEYTVQTADYVSYGSRAITELDASDVIAGHELYKYTHIPFYSYPCAWSDLSDYATTVVFRIAWRIQGESGYQWKKYQLSPNISTLSLERNKFYRTFVNVRSLGGADKESFVVIPECDYEIIPWMNEDASGSGQGIVPGELITYKYLVMDHPEQTINNETTVYFSYVSSSPIQSVKITSIQYYNNSDANPLKTQNVNNTITDDEKTISTNAGNITVNKSNPGYVTIYHSLDNMYSAVTINATITNEDGCTQDVTVVQNPSISLIREGQSGDVFVNGYFARVSNSPFGTSWTSGGSTYYRDPKSTNSTSAVTMPSPSSEYGTTIYKGTGNSGGGLTTFYTTEIRISSFNTNNNTYTYTYGGSQHTEVYRIGDPRKTTEEVYGSSWTLHPYLYYNNTAQGATQAWQEPLRILTTSQNAEDQNIVAPKFLVSSSLNAMLTTGLPTFDQAVSRAAVYQEAGYPAGRWRIPTEAEMAFIVARQQDGTIPDLYVAGSDYWSGSGRLMNISSSGTTITMKNGSGAKESVRFVYDLWYWGDEPSTTNIYHPNGHLYNYDASGNSTLIR